MPFDVGGGVLRFTAETLSTDYTGENVYVLTWGDEPPTLRTRLTRSEPAVPRGFSRVKQSTIYLASAPEGTDPWLWDLLFGDGSTWPDSSEPELGQFDLAGLPSRIEGRVPVRVRFLGRTTHQHNVSASINGIAVGSLTFTGAVGAVLEGSVPGSALLASGNRLSINYTASGGPPGEVGLIYLDSLELGVKLKPQAPVAVDRVAAFAPYGPLRELDYLILSYGDFLDAARRLADLERSAGYKTAVVDVERAYDTYSAGIVEAAALRELLKDATRGGRLKYVLLLGGDTFDTHDYLGTGAVAFVPSLDAWDGEFGRVPSENRYADLNGDGKPELAIGRLPARTAEEAALLVEKVAAGAFSTDLQLFAVDNQGPSDINFEAEADSVAGSMPLSDTLFARVQDGVGVARAALFAGLAQGVAGLHYFGHAGTQQLADEDLMTVDDMASLDGTPATNVFLWACEAQWYQGIYGRSLGESLLLVPRGGTGQSDLSQDFESTMLASVDQDTDSGFSR